MSQLLDPVAEFALTLSDLAQLPLDRVLVSASLEPDGLGKVGGMTAKAKLLDGDDIAALGVSTKQDDLPPGKTLLGKPLLRAGTLADMAHQMHNQLGDALYGRAVPLPDVLRDISDVEAHTDAAFDYRSSRFHNFGHLDKLIHDAIFFPAESVPIGVMPPTPPANTLTKHLNKGYINILGTAGFGKTSWALNWVRRSLGQASQRSNKLPALAGWYFARRYGALGGTAGEAYQDELQALQTLISLTRRRYNVVPKQAQLLTDDEVRDYADKFNSKRSDQDRKLKDIFTAALREVASEVRPSAATPIVLLLDGADEMWSPGGNTGYVRLSFPTLLPGSAELPDHVYFVILSRPGRHMDWRVESNNQPLLQYEFNPKEVAYEIKRYLNGRAEMIEATHPRSEAATILRSEVFQNNVCAASESAFGYVPLLFKSWIRGATEHDINTLREWQHNQSSLPRGIYGLRAREFIGLQLALRDSPDTRLQRPSGSTEMSPDALGLAEVLALVTVLRWSMGAKTLMDLLYPNDFSKAFRNWADERKHLQLVLEMGGAFLYGTGATGEHLRFGHLSLAEIAIAAWRLECANYDVTEESLITEVLANAHAEQFAESVASGRPVAPGGRPRNLTSAQRIRADSELHHTVARACQAWWLDQDPARAGKPWLGPADEVADAEAYAVVWGPWHALKAGATVVSDKAARHPDANFQSGSAKTEDARRAQKLLVNAAYLQSAIRSESQQSRVQQREPSADALRESFIAAGQVYDADPEQALRHRIEIALLEWHPHIVGGRVHVGGLLWNLLGAWPLGKEHAESWKSSIDTPAIITSYPGRPSESEVVRRIAGFQEGVFSPCGCFLLTRSRSGSAIWELKDGFLRARQIAFLPLVLSNLHCSSIGREILIVGSQDERIVLVVVNSVTGLARQSQYAGCHDPISSIALHVDCQDNDQESGMCYRMWVVCGSFERDGGYGGTRTIGVLTLSDTQLRSHFLDQARPDAKPVNGCMALYEVEEPVTTEIVQQVYAKGEVPLLWVACGSGEGTINLLRLTETDLHEHIHEQATNGTRPRRHSFARYRKRSDYLGSIALYVDVTSDPLRLWVATHSHNGICNLLRLEDSDISQHIQGSAEIGASPRTDSIACYQCDVGALGFFALHVDTKSDRPKMWVINVSLDGNTASVLHLSDAVLFQHIDEQTVDGAESRKGCFAYFRRQDSLDSKFKLRTTKWTSFLDARTGSVSLWLVGTALGETEINLIHLTLREKREEYGSVFLESFTSRHETGHQMMMPNISLHLDARSASSQLWVVHEGRRGAVVLRILSDKRLLEDAVVKGNGEVQGGPDCYVRYEGHQDLVSSTALQVEEWSDAAQLWVASTSRDGTVGLLPLSVKDVHKHMQAQAAHGAKPVNHCIARYIATKNNSKRRGDRRPMLGFSQWGRTKLVVDATTKQEIRLWVASSHEDGTIHLLSLRHNDVLLHVAKQANRKAKPLAGCIARYRGRRYSITLKALHVSAISESVCMWIVGFEQPGYGNQMEDRKRILRLLRIGEREHIQHLQEQADDGAQPEDACIAGYLWDDSYSSHSIEIHWDIEQAEMPGIWVTEFTTDMTSETEYEDSVRVLRLSGQQLREHVLAQAEPGAEPLDSSLRYPLRGEVNVSAVRAKLDSKTNEAHQYRMLTDGGSFGMLEFNEDQTSLVTRQSVPGEGHLVQRPTDSHHVSFRHIGWAEAWPRKMGWNYKMRGGYGEELLGLSSDCLLWMLDEPMKTLSVNLLCPLNCHEFKPQNAAPLGTNEAVVVGIIGNDVALMLIEYIKPI